ncbi:Spx/MgsR family RNA polymerase-binding regulatory protein [Algoriphagus lutimaris]|uniref:Spx/MgsR family RNA polymerase-binding regulatory protein n=1 Tax=Algoriphagus lutimaris TaxID=613197 RepID=UPI00196B0552|nr:Spx/MgsR family RNA polymerase-binding regulatory protein [Algoriphagus lutimaris]MBN3519988.1 Spx/MgsR family RNA polymerase-binding regulatory protein [Algoriphagus lutimaris]
MAVKVYGIKNCNTMKKAFEFLQEKGVDYEFFDYKKQKPTKELLESFLTKTDLDSLINRKGMTFRKLDDQTKESLNDSSKAIDLLIDHSSMIKRPVIVYPNGALTLGFDPEAISEQLA